MNSSEITIHIIISIKLNNNLFITIKLLLEFEKALNRLAFRSTSDQVKKECYTEQKKIMENNQRFLEHFAKKLKSKLHGYYINVDIYYRFIATYFHQNVISAEFIVPLKGHKNDFGESTVFQILSVTYSCWRCVMIRMCLTRFFYHYFIQIL